MSKLQKIIKEGLSEINVTIEKTRAPHEHVTKDLIGVVRVDNYGAEVAIPKELATDHIIRAMHDVAAATYGLAHTRVGGNHQLQHKIKGHIPYIVIDLKEGAMRIERSYPVNYGYGALEPVFDQLEKDLGNL